MTGIMVAVTEDPQCCRDPGLPRGSAADQAIVTRCEEEYCRVTYL